MSPSSPALVPGRDEPFRPGRPKISGGATLYTLPGVPLGTVATFGYTANRDYYTGFEVRAGIVVDQLAVEVSTLHASNIRLGIYRASVDMQPIGAPLADSGDISTGTTGVKTYTPGTPLFLARGRYLTVSNQSGTALLRKFDLYGSDYGGVASGWGANPLGLWSVSRAYAAFPTPGMAWDTLTSQSNTWCSVLLRVSTP